MKRSKMSDSDSVTDWIERFENDGNPEAAQKLFDRYYPRLLCLARVKLRRATTDDEDVALSAFKSFFARVEAGDYQLNDRDNLWSLIVTITVRKAVERLRHLGRQKRGGGSVLCESDMLREGQSDQEQYLADFPGQEPDPEFAALWHEECQHLLGMLDARGREIALRKLEGYTNKEIAKQIDKSIQTVERVLRVIRKKWGAKQP